MSYNTSTSVENRSAQIPQRQITQLAPSSQFYRSSSLTSPYTLRAFLLTTLGVGILTEITNQYSKANFSLVHKKLEYISNNVLFQSLPQSEYKKSTTLNPWPSNIYWFGLTYDTVMLRSWVPKHRKDPNCFGYYLSSRWNDMIRHVADYMIK